MSLGLGSVSRLMTRSLYATLNSRTSWYERLELSDEASAELEFSSKQLADFNGQGIWPTPYAIRVIYSDAGDTGYGGYIVEHGSCVADSAGSSQI